MPVLNPNKMKKITVIRYAIVLIIFVSVIFHSSHIGAQDFQRCFGTPIDNAFSKVIKDGTFYYVLGQGLSEPQCLPYLMMRCDCPMET